MMLSLLGDGENAKFHCGCILAYVGVFRLVCTGLRGAPDAVFW